MQIYRPAKGLPDLLIQEFSPLTGVDPGRLLRLLEDDQKLKFIIRTVKSLPVTLIEHSNIQVSYIITVIE